MFHATKLVTSVVNMVTKKIWAKTIELWKPNVFYLLQV
jgi:hypothetical protein